MVIRRRKPQPGPAKIWFNLNWERTAPDYDTVRRFIRSTKRSPDARLAVLTDLRHHSMAPTSSLGSLVIGLVATALAGFAIIVAAGRPTDPDAAYLAVGAAVFVFLFIVVATGFYVLFDERSTNRRRTFARLWLEAVNDQLHR